MSSRKYTKTSTDEGVPDLDEAIQWDLESYRWVIQLVGVFFLYFVSQHGATTNLDVWNQSTLFSLVIVSLSFILPDYTFDSLSILWRIPISAVQYGSGAAVAQSFLSIVSCGVLLLASVTATIATHWRTGDYHTLLLLPSNGITTWQAIYYEALGRTFLLVIWTETKHISTRLCSCRSLTHETACTRCGISEGFSPFIVGFAVTGVFYLTATTSGGSVDVMRAFGPAIMSGTWTGILNAFYGQMGAQIVVGTLYLLKNKFVAV